MKPGFRAISWGKFLISWFFFNSSWENINSANIDLFKLAFVVASLCEDLESQEAAGSCFFWLFWLFWLFWFWGFFSSKLLKISSVSTLSERDWEIFSSDFILFESCSCLFLENNEEKLIWKLRFFEELDQLAPAVWKPVWNDFHFEV